MIEYSKFKLKNGLRVIVHTDRSTPMVAVNVLYDVGSRDENPERTGFAHLFEHLMFGGSANIPDFDTPIQLAGGENNAFTNSDMTNFYNILPSENIETALWLESDRMMQLDFSQKKLDVQKKVVVEEFKETCLNIPYGDLWHHLFNMAFKYHSYRWPTIGLVPDHISNAQLSEVKDFFYKYYRPNNAILVLAGDIDLDRAKSLAEKWFGNIPKGDVPERSILVEPPQTEKIQRIVRAAVPLPAVFLAFRMPGRNSPEYYGCDLLSDILSNGRSSRLYKRLFKERHIFSEIDAFISGTLDPGLFIVEGKPMPGVSIDQALEAIWNELEDIKVNGVSEHELKKVKNKVESSLVYSEVNILNKAISLAYFELLEDSSLINSQSEKYQNVTTDYIQQLAQKLFTEDNTCELIYHPN